MTSLVLPHLSSSLTDSMPSLTLLCHSKTDARFMQDGRNAVWSIPYVFVAFFPSLKQNFIAYRSSKVSWRPDCIFEIPQLWQSGFSRVYFNCCCSCSFEAEIIKIGLSSHKIYSNNILNVQESMTILNACKKKSGDLLKAPRKFVLILRRFSPCVLHLIVTIIFCYRPNNTSREININILYNKLSPLIQHNVQIIGRDMNT